jgi:hypothetical protein
MNMYVVSELNKSKTNFHTKKMKISCHQTQKKKKASNLTMLVDFKRKQQDCLQVFYWYHETKLFGVH